MTDSPPAVAVAPEPPPARAAVCFVADRPTFERIGASLRYLLLGLIDEPILPILLGPTGPRRMLLEGTLDVVEWDPPRRYWKTRYVRQRLNEIMEHVERANAEGAPVVHALSTDVEDTAELLAEGLGAELAVTLLDADSLGRHSTRTRLQHAAATIVPSETYRDELRRHNLSLGTLEVVRAGYPAASSLAAFRDADRAPALVTCGPLDFECGVDDLLRAFAALRSSDDRPLLFVLGRGPAERDLRELSDQLGVSAAVVFAEGMEPYGDALAGADVFVLPRAERQGLVTVIQAMALGLTVIAGDGGMLDTLVHDETAWLFAPGDVDALARHLKRALERPQEARELAARGQARAKVDHSVSAMVERLSRLYRRLAMGSRTLPLRPAP